MPENSLLGWARSWEGRALILFVCGSMFLNGENAMQVLGVLMCGVFLMGYACSRVTGASLYRLAPEVKFYALWVLWAGATGPIAAVNLMTFWESYRTVLQMLVMIVVVYCILCMHRQSLAGVFLAVCCGGGVLVGSALLGVDSLTASLESKDQATGLTDNANTLGMCLVWATLSFLLLLGFAGRMRKWVYTVGLLAAPFFVYVLLASASRKSFVAFLLLLGGWATFGSATRKTLADHIKRSILVVLSIAVLWGGLSFIMQNTLLGRRLQLFSDKSNGSLTDAVDGEERYSMYVEGLRMFLENPITGVGLDNFSELFWSHKYSHSDYIEPLATTGLVGFVLYQSFYFFILRRAIGLLEHVSDEAVVYRLKIIIIGIVTIMLMGLGSPHYQSLPVFILLTSFCVYTSDIERQTGSSRAFRREVPKQSRLCSPGCVARLASGSFLGTAAKAPVISGRRFTVND